MTDEAPRRVHPATIAIDLVKSAPSTLLGLPALLAFGAEFGLGRVILFTLLGVGAMAFFTWLGWRNFTYAIVEDQLVISRGVLNRSRRTIPLARVQDVSIEQKLLARIFDLAFVRIETGGSQTDEATLDSVTLPEAQRLRAALRRLPASVPAETEAEAATFAMPIGRVLLYGLFNFSLVWLAAILGILQTFDDLIGFDWSDLIGTAQREVRSHFTIGAGASVLAVGLALGILAGVARTLAREYGFTLVDRGDTFRRIRGLLTRSEVTVVKARIQLTLVRRALVSGRLGWQSLHFQTLGGSDDRSGRQEMAPFGRGEEVAAVVDAAGLPRFERAGLIAVANRHALRAVLRRGVPPTLVFGVAGWFYGPIWLGLALVPIMVAVGLQERRHHRYALRDSSLQVTRGVLSQRDWTVPYPAIQSITVRRSWLQRRLGLASVHADTAGGRGGHRPYIEDLWTADAGAVAVELLARA